MITTWETIYTVCGLFLMLTLPGAVVAWIGKRKSWLYLYYSALGFTLGFVFSFLYNGVCGVFGFECGVTSIHEGASFFLPPLIGMVAGIAIRFFQTGAE